MPIFLNVINPTNLTNLSDLTSEFRETSSATKISFLVSYRTVNLRPPPVPHFIYVLFRLSLKYYSQNDT